MRISSTSPASRNEPARRGPPSSRMLWTPIAPSLSSASVTRSASVPPGRHDHLHAGGLQPFKLRALGGPGRDHEQRHLRRGVHEPAVGRQPGLGVEHDPRRLPHGTRGTRGQQRVVRECGADADADGVELGAPAVDEAAALLAGDPLRVAGLRRDVAVEAHRRLEHHQRAARPRVLAKRLVEQPRAVRHVAVHDLHVDALVAQDPETAPGRLCARVVGGDHDAADAGPHDRVRAGRGLALVAARLERHVHRRPDRVDLACGQGSHLRVLAAVGGVIALARAPGRRGRPRPPRGGWGGYARGRAPRARSPSTCAGCPAPSIRAPSCRFYSAPAKSPCNHATEAQAPLVPAPGPHADGGSPPWGPVARRPAGSG